MRNKTVKYIHLAMLVVVLAAQLWPALTSAQSRANAPATDFEKICSFKDDKGKFIQDALYPCIGQIYLFSLGAGALIALLMVVLAGYRYMTAGGNAEQVSTAKESLEMAFKGLIIIFVAFILLYLINPDLVQFKPLALPPLIPVSDEATSGGGGDSSSSITVSMAGREASYVVGDSVAITFSAAPAGTYQWTFDDCAGDQLPDGLNFTSGSSPRISGTVSGSAVVGVYSCEITASIQSQSASKDFRILVSPP